MEELLRIQWEIDIIINKRLIENLNKFQKLLLHRDTILRNEWLSLMDFTRLYHDYEITDDKTLRIEIYNEKKKLVK